MNITTIREALQTSATPVPLEGDHYASSLAIYEAASDQRARILAWTREALIPQLQAERTSILSVGCGAGDLDKEILAASSEQSNLVAYVGLEPDARQCERFLSQMGDKTNRRVQVEARNVGFEDLHDPRRYDLVIMVHSLYYMTDPAWAVEKAMGLVKDGGRLVILLAANDTLNELSSSFWEVEADREAWFSENLGAYLDELGMSYDRERIEARLNVTECFNPDSAAGTQIADFIAQVATKKLTPKLQGMIAEYLDATSEHDGQQRWLPHNVDAFTIKQQAVSYGKLIANAGR
ncbi:MAG: class I SAM-dependent methyltransferase [Gammaproteobacteria bacterium]